MVGYDSVLCLTLNAGWSEFQKAECGVEIFIFCHGKDSQGVNDENKFISTSDQGGGQVLGVPPLAPALVNSLLKYRPLACFSRACYTWHKRLQLF